MKKYRVLYFGTWGYGNAGLEALLSLDNVDVVTVYTKWDLKNGSDYLNAVYFNAKNNKLETINSSREILDKDSFNSSILSHEDIDFVFSCCYDRLFSKKILEIPKYFSVNVHPSLLPKYKGVKPLENALANGEKTVGVSIHELVKELDTGDIIMQEMMYVDQKDTFAEIYNRQCVLIKSMIKDFFNDPQIVFDNKIPQDISKETFAPRLPFAIDDTDNQLDIINKYNLNRK